LAVSDRLSSSLTDFPTAITPPAWSASALDEAATDQTTGLRVGSLARTRAAGSIVIAIVERSAGLAGIARISGWTLAQLDIGGMRSSRRPCGYRTLQDYIAYRGSFRGYLGCGQDQYVL